MLTTERRIPWWPEVLLLLALSLSAAWIVNVGRPEPLPWKGDFKVRKVEETTRKGLAVMEPGEARAALAKGAHTFVDAREPDEFAMGHIPGAVNIPAEALATGLDDAVAGLAKDKPLIIYCGGLSCPKSKELAEGLKMSGYTNVTVLPEGMEGWKAAGGPVEAK